MIFTFWKKLLCSNQSKIPRRQLTKKSTEELYDTIYSILKEMLINSCPCHYPRYRDIVSFHHRNYNTGPVFCADTNYFVSCSSDKDLDFLVEIKKIPNINTGFDDVIYSCRKCSTIYREITKQYSINFEFSYFVIENKTQNLETGKKTIKPIPLLQGLYGFHNKDIRKCSFDFTLKNKKEFFKYFTETNI